jgi:hypothetical protein
MTVTATKLSQCTKYQVTSVQKICGRADRGLFSFLRTQVVF